MNRSKLLNLIKRYLVGEIDETLAFLGLMFSLVLTVYFGLTMGCTIFVERARGILSTATMALFFLAFAIYLFIKKSPSSFTLPSLASVKISNRLYLASNVLFSLFFAYSVLSLLLRSDPYTRPLSYFVAVALMAAMLAVEILFLLSRKWCNYLVLFKIVLIGLSLEFSQLLIFPNLVGGIDPWQHQMFTLNILNAGHVPEGNAYSHLPLMHLMIGETSLITGLDYKIATMLSISLSQVLCNILFTFLLGSFLFNNKVGLLGGLLIGVANWHVYWGYWTIPTTMAAVFMPIIIYLLFRVRVQKQYIVTFPVILLMGALILTHPLTTACMGMLLFTFWTGFKVHNRIYRGHARRGAPVTLIISALFVTEALSWWTYASGHISELAEFIKRGFSLDYFLIVPPKEIIQYSYSIPLSEQLFNGMGTALFLAISIIGCLFMVSKFGNSRSFLIAIGGVVTLMLSFSFALRLSGYEGRWFYFSQILLAIPLALALFLFCWTVKSKLEKALFLAALTFSLSFLMILSYPTTIDGARYLSPNTQVRDAFTESELQAIRRVSQIWSEKIGVDTSYAKLQWQQYPVEDISEQIYNKNYTDCQNIFVLIREEIVNHPFTLFGVYKLNYDPRESLTTQAFSKVYDCGSVSGFVYAEGAPMSGQ